MRAGIRMADRVRERALANGPAGERWLKDLPDVVAQLADAWGLDLGEPFEGGTAAYVVAATDQAHGDCVLKVAMALDRDEKDAFARSVRVYELAAGRGC